MRTFALCTAVVAIALSGCVSTNATMLGAAQAGGGAAVDPSTVAIYRTVDQVPGPYTEVALLNSRGDSMWTDEKKMYESMRKEAAKLGANGVILDGVKEPSAGVKVAAAVFGVSAQRKGQALAIRLKPAS